MLFFSSTVTLIHPTSILARLNISNRNHLVRSFKKLYGLMTSSAPPKLPIKPLPPAPEDCCDSGCNLCVKDVYQQELKIWEAECQRILLNQAEKSNIGPLTYLPCQIIKREQVSSDCFKFTFNCDGYIKVLPGHHFICRDIVDSELITRQYTPVEVPTPSKFNLSFLIKIYPNGELTSRIMNRWIEGSKVEWRGPCGEYNHSPGQFTKYLVVVAGTGITPVLSVAKQIVDNENDITTVKVLYSTQKFASILLREDLKELSAYWNFKMKYFLTQESKIDDLRYRESGVNRRMNGADLEQEILQPLKTRVLICGTKQFNSDIKRMVLNLNVPDSNIHIF